MTDTDVVKAVTYYLLENGAADATGTTLMTPQFSVNQIVAAINQRQWRFLKESGCITSQETLSAPAGQQTYTMPNTYIDTRRLAFTPNGGQTYSLQRADSWEIDAGMPDWDYSTGNPTVWNESTLPQRKLDIAPIPANTGSLSHLYVAVSSTVTNSGVDLTVPDIFSWAIVWGVIADLLSSDGEGLDVARAQYAEERYQQGVELCRILIEGMTN